MRTCRVPGAHGPMKKTAKQTLHVLKILITGDKGNELNKGVMDDLKKKNEPETVGCSDLRGERAPWGGNTERKTEGCGQKKSFTGNSPIVCHEIREERVTHSRIRGGGTKVAWSCASKSSRLI